MTVFMNYDSPAIIVGGGNDHIHALVQVSKNYLLPKIIGETKRSSSKWIKNKSTFLSKFQWQKGYGAFSIGESTEYNIETVNRLEYLVLQNE
jgi:REP element-mobilizing transposase RayT